LCLSLHLRLSVCCTLVAPENEELFAQTRWVAFGVCVCVCVCRERERERERERGIYFFGPDRRFSLVARVCKCPPIIEKRI
jgi:hypothetical protein